MNASSLPTASADASHHPHHRDEDVIARLKASQIFRDYQEAFETATGLPLVLRAAGSFDAPMRGASNIASFCALMGGANKTCAACLRLQGEFEREPFTEAKTLQCF